MNDGRYPPLTDNMDDLPRTLRREREARERAQREQQVTSDRLAVPAQQNIYGSPEPVNPYDAPLAYAGSHAPAEAYPAIVTRLQVPFGSLMIFFIKAVFAAIPALLILAAMLYGAGLLLKAFFPWIVQMEILIRFPK